MSKTIIGLLAFGAACGPTTHHGNFGNGSGDIDAATGGSDDRRARVRDVGRHRREGRARPLRDARPIRLDGRLGHGRHEVERPSRRAHDVPRPAGPRRRLGRHPVLRLARTRAAASATRAPRADYAAAEVEIAPLPGVASQIIVARWARTRRRPATPTSAALQGAIDHAKRVGGRAPRRRDGGDPRDRRRSDRVPDEHRRDRRRSRPRRYAATPKIPTFVIGVGSSLSNLNGIASAGGTTSAFLVDTGGNVNQQFLQAMNDIRHAALGCTYSIPTDRTAARSTTARSTSSTSRATAARR